MSEGARLQVRYDQLVSGFVAPLLRGGKVNVEQAIAPGALAYFEHARASDLGVELEIHDRLHAAASAIAPVLNVRLWPERNLLLLAMAAHNLTLLTDPTLDRLFARSARDEVLLWVDALIDRVTVPRTRGEALGRHALLDAVPGVRRLDVVVKNWAYTYRFHGRPVPSNVTALPKLRMVRTAERKVGVPELFRGLDEQGLEVSLRLRELLARSPVTELLRPDLAPSFRFGWASLLCLSDDAIRGGIARSVVERGEWAAAKAFGAALGDRTLRDAAPPMVYYALALLFEVQMTATFDAPGPNLPDRLDLADPDVARFAAVVPAFFDDPTMLDEVRAFGGKHRSEVQARSARLRDRLPPAVLSEVSNLVRRARRPGPASARREREMRP